MNPEEIKKLVRAINRGKIVYLSATGDYRPVDRVQNLEDHDNSDELREFYDVSAETNHLAWISGESFASLEESKASSFYTVKRFFQRNKNENP